jgi:hypothetical protein
VSTREPTSDGPSLPDPAAGEDEDRTSRDLDVSAEPEPDWAEAIRRARRERADRLREALRDTEDEPTGPAE